MSATSTPHSELTARRQLIDVRGAAKYLGTTERHVRRLAEERRIGFIKLGDGRSARLRFDIEKLDAWLDDHTFNPGEGA